MRASLGMSRLSRLCVTFAFMMLLLGCSSSNVQSAGPHSARWVKRQITLYEAPAKRATSRVTSKSIYAGEPVYLIPSPCCDKFDYLYDSRGFIVCAPSGGFTGRGDGNCPEGIGAATAKDP